MAKECKVVTNNEAVTVFDYDGTLVQIPSIHEDVKTINVVFKNGYYTVVGDDYIEDTKPTEKANTKKTTIDKTAKKVKSENENA